MTAENCQMIYGARQSPSRLVLDQRPNIISGELFSTWQEFQLHQEDEADNFSTQLLDEIDNSARRAACRQQIIGNDHTMPSTYSIAVYFECVLTIFEIVGDRRALGRKFARLSHRHKPGVEVIS